jgi:hypothetical protein
MTKTGWSALVALVMVGGAMAVEPVEVTPGNLKDVAKEKELSVTGQLVNVLPDRKNNKWVFVLHIDGVVPASYFHHESKGADVLVEMRNDKDDDKLLTMWRNYQAEGKRTPVTVTVTGKGEYFRTGVAFSSLPDYAGESSVKASLGDARLAH